MTLFTNIKQRLSSLMAPSTPPVIQTLSYPYTFFAEVRTGNYIKSYDAMVDIDADLCGYLTRIAHMCKQAYTGIQIEGGEHLDPKEEEMRQLAQDIAKQLDFKGEFFSIAFDLMKYGDVVKHIVAGVDGISELQSLPRFKLTAVESQNQYGDRTASILRAKTYVVDEGTESQQTFPAGECMHVALNNKSTYMRDILGRNTYGVWSASPINTLVWYLEWKVNTMINDILWSHRNVPREWHKLDLSAFNPDNYSGTREVRERAALAAAQQAANAYSQNLQARQVDVGIVTDKNTDISYVEPKSTNYQQPNLKIDQINEAISNAIGLPPVAKDTTYASALISGSFAMLQALSIAEIIRDKLEDVLKEAILLRSGNKYAAIIDRVRIRLRLILEKDRTEIMRQIAVMTESRCFTPTEIREEWGKDPLTPLQKQEILEMFPSATHDASQTVTDITEDVKRKRWTVWPDYPSEMYVPQK